MRGPYRLGSERSVPVILLAGTLVIASAIAFVVGAGLSHG